MCNYWESGQSSARGNFAANFLAAGSAYQFAKDLCSGTGTQKNDGTYEYRYDYEPYEIPGFPGFYTNVPVPADSNPLHLPGQYAYDSGLYQSPAADIPLDSPCLDDCIYGSLLRSRTGASNGSPR